MASELKDIVVLLREVRDPRPPVRVEGGGAAIRETGLRRLTNPADLSALEVAVALAGTTGGAVTAVAVGDERLDDSLRLALSMGAARAIRVWDGALEGGDAVAEATVLRRVLEVIRPSLFFTGHRLLDRGDDPAAALAAASHGMPFAQAALSFELARDRARVVRKAEKGGRQALLLCLPCAVFFDATAAEPRYPELPAVLASLAAPIALWGIEELGLPAWELGFAGAVLRPASHAFPRHDPLRVATPDPTLPAHERVRALFTGGIRPRGGRMHFGSADDTVEGLVRILVDEGLLPGGQA